MTGTLHQKTITLAYLLLRSWAVAYQLLPPMMGHLYINIMEVLLDMKLDMPPVTWKRARGGKTTGKFIDKKLRKYYNHLYYSYRDAGLKPVAKDVRLFIQMDFCNADPYWRDIDNLEKAIYDAGQISKWGTKEQKVFLPDFWDDKQFFKVHKEKHMRASKDLITIQIFKMDDENESKSS